MSTRRRVFKVSALIAVTCLIVSSFAWVPLIVASDPLVRMPGSQPAQGITLEAANRCLNCHADYVAGSEIEPGDGWMGSMMAQAGRDPIFWACLTVAAQDSIWALGNANAVDLCERCHFPGGWLGGRSDPPNVSAMTGSDYDGLTCDFCHRMYDPFYETTFNGTREGSDWLNYWNEATSLSATSASTTYTQDRTESAGIKMFDGTDFYTKTFVPQYGSYTESGSGQFFVAADATKRASFADAEPSHQFFYSRFHKSKYFCATCHDVSNPALANLGLSGLPDQSGGMHLISEQYPASRYFHVERTFSEFMLSAYAQQGGTATNPEFAAASGGIVTAAKCQDCHMFDVTGRGCDKTRAPIRPTESTEHPAGGTPANPNSGLPMHDMTGGNAWISHILASLDPAGPVYDAVNAQILGQPATAITLDLNVGLSPKNNGAKVYAGAVRAKDQLRLAATIKNFSYNTDTGALTFRIQNNTGHKLISGFPEGRRMFVHIEAYENGALRYEANPYDMNAGTLKGLSPTYSPSSPALWPTQHYVDELVYEVHPKSDLTGEHETFHFVLATGRYKDNRIPPKGFNVSASGERISTPVWHGADAPDYFTADEYAGGYDQIDLQIPAGCDYVSVELYYQGTSREYIEFLKNEINGTASTLSSPTPSGEAQAYIIQTDPFFAKLRPWGNIIWDLWFHNHGMDGSGKKIDGIVPYKMASVSIGTKPARAAADIVDPWGVDLTDFSVFSAWWQRTDCAANADCGGADFDKSGAVDLADLTQFCTWWLWGK